MLMKLTAKEMYEQELILINMKDRPPHILNLPLHSI